MRPCPERISLPLRDPRDENIEQIISCLAHARKGALCVQVRPLRMMHGTPLERGFLNVLPNFRSGNNWQASNPQSIVRMLCDMLPMGDDERAVAIREQPYVDNAFRCSELSPERISSASFANWLKQALGAHALIGRESVLSAPSAPKLLNGAKIFKDGESALPIEARNYEAIGRIISARYAQCLRDHPAIRAMADLARDGVKLCICGFSVKDMVFASDASDASAPDERDLHAKFIRHLSRVCVPNHVYLVLFELLAQLGLVTREIMNF